MTYPPPPTSRLQGSYTTLDFCSSFCSWYGLMTSNKKNIAFDFGSFVVRYGVGNIMYSIWRQCLDMQSSKVDMKHLPWSLEVVFRLMVLSRVHTLLCMVCISYSTLLSITPTVNVIGARSFQWTWMDTEKYIMRVKNSKRRRLLSIETIILSR